MSHCAYLAVAITISCCVLQSNYFQRISIHCLNIVSIVLLDIGIHLCTQTLKQWTRTQTHTYTQMHSFPNTNTRTYTDVLSHTLTQNNYPAGPGSDSEIQNSLICVKYFCLFVYGSSSANSDTELMLAEDDCIYKGK